MSDKVSKKRIDKRRIDIVLTNVYLDTLDHLVKKGVYMNRQIAIRAGLRLLFLHHGLESFFDKGAELKDDAPSE